MKGLSAMNSYGLMMMAPMLMGWPDGGRYGSRPAYKKTKTHRDKGKRAMIKASKKSNRKRNGH